MNANIILPTLIAKSAVGIHTVFALRHFLLIFYNLVFVFLNQNSKRTRKEVDKKPQRTRIGTTRIDFEGHSISNSILKPFEFI